VWQASGHICTEPWIQKEAIDFMLSPYRDLTTAKHFLQLALYRSQQIRPRVINVDGHLAYARAITELKASGALGRRCRCRPSPYLNNILEQDHRFVKKRIAAGVPVGRGFAVDRLNQRGYAAEFAAHPGFCDDGLTAPSGNECTHVGHVGPVA